MREHAVDVGRLQAGIQDAPGARPRTAATAPWRRLAPCPCRPRRRRRWRSGRPDALASMPSPFKACFDAATSCARTSFFSTLPTGLRGSVGQNSTCFGVFRLPKRLRHISITSSAVRRGAGLELDHRGQAFAPVGVGHADHGAVLHRGVAPDHLLDLARVDVEAARDDHVLLAVDHVQVAALVEHADVAGMVPAEGARLGGGFGVVVIAGRHQLAARDDLAAFARRRRCCRRRPSVPPRRRPRGGRPRPDVCRVRRRRA